jgi:hypothetical protein
MTHWPKGTPKDIAELADRLYAVCEGKLSPVVLPALALVLSDIIAQTARRRDDQEAKQAIYGDVGELARRYGALTTSPKLN